MIAGAPFLTIVIPTSTVQDFGWNIVTEVTTSTLNFGTGTAVNYAPKYLMGTKIVAEFPYIAKYISEATTFTGSTGN